MVLVAHKDDFDGEAVESAFDFWIFGPNGETMTAKQFHDQADVARKYRKANKYKKSAKK